MENELLNNFGGIKTFHNFVELVAACPTFDTTPKREAIRDQMPQNVQGAWPSNSSNTKQATEEILKVCYNYSRVKSLIDIIILKENDSKPGLALQTFIGESLKEMKIGPFSYTQLARLDLIFKKSRPVPQELRQVYKDVAPIGLPPVHDLEEMLHNLSAQSREAGPLLNFLAKIASLPSAARLELNQWIGDAHEVLGITVAPQPLPVAEPVTTPRKALIWPGLLIALRPAGAVSSERYNVLAWWTDLGTAEYEPLQKDWKSISKAALPKLLSELIDRCIDKGMSKDLIIEFLLPRELLCLELETLKHVDTGEVISTRYPIVVRAFDRHQEIDFKGANRQWWTDNWNQLAQTVVDETTIWISDEAEVRYNVISSRLRNNPVPYLGMALPLPSLPDLKPKQPHKHEDAMRAALLNGVPTALWPRCGTPGFTPQQLREELEKRLKGKALVKLPEIIRDLRNEAEGILGQPHIGRDLILLWDNPNLKPTLPTKEAKAPWRS